ncbi:MAG: ABC transporter ATP-binding protein [Caulobacteraceae bacterium]|nr:ABC transporter ATP-binding protein [Caulobacteraceae bacterium]
MRTEGALGLEAHGLTVRLGGRAVVDRVDLAFAPGAVTAVLGPNGAGKSTLLSCLAGLRRPQAGEARLGGRSLAVVPGKERAHLLGYLPQSPEIAWSVDVRTFAGLGRTVRVGAFGPSDVDRAAVARALAVTQLTDLADRDVTTLSGGERARAHIARVLAGEPRWMIADEPLTGLDPSHQLDAADLMRGFAQAGGGVVVTLHDLAFAARFADRVVVLAEGRVLADGTPAEALAPDILARAYAIDARWTSGAAGPLLEVVARR